MNVFIYQPETDTLTEIIDDTTAMVGKNNLQHLFLPTRNWYMYWYNMYWLEDTIALLCLLGWCLQLCTAGDSPMYREILNITLGFRINYGTLNITLILPPIHTHTSPKVPFSSLLNFCLRKQEFGYLNNLKYLNKP